MLIARRYSVKKGIKMCNITFDANGGTVDSGSGATTVPEGTLWKDVVKPECSKGIEEFSGFGTTTTGGMLSPDYVVTGDMAVYALWNALEITVLTYRGEHYVPETFASSVSATRSNEGTTLEPNGLDRIMLWIIQKGDLKMGFPSLNFQQQAISALPLLKSLYMLPFYSWDFANDYLNWCDANNVYKFGNFIKYNGVSGKNEWEHGSIEDFKDQNYTDKESTEMVIAQSDRWNNGSPLLNFYKEYQHEKAGIAKKSARIISANTYNFITNNASNRQKIKNALINVDLSYGFNEYNKFVMPGYSLSGDFTSISGCGPSLLSHFLPVTSLGETNLPQGIGFGVNVGDLIMNDSNLSWTIWTNPDTQTCVYFDLTESYIKNDNDIVVYYCNYTTESRSANVFSSDAENPSPYSSISMKEVEMSCSKHVAVGDSIVIPPRPKWGDVKSITGDTYKFVGWIIDNEAVYTDAFIDYNTSWNETNFPGNSGSYHVYKAGESVQIQESMINRKDDFNFRNSVRFIAVYKRSIQTVNYKFEFGIAPIAGYSFTVPTLTQSPAWLGTPYSVKQGEAISPNYVSKYDGNFNNSGDFTVDDYTHFRFIGFIKDKKTCWIKGVNDEILEEMVDQHRREIAWEDATYYTLYQYIP